jgi:EAL domain-containing protein (putative c-di-GMP-specific phosphodiesterase class I)
VTEKVESPLVLAAQGSEQARQLTVEHSPFSVGRSTGMDLQIESRDVSSRHARFVIAGGGDWLLQDMGSTNGTFLNGQRVAEHAALKVGDVINFASRAYRVLDSGMGTPPRDATVFLTDTSDISGNIELSQVLDNKQVFSVFQPIYRASDGAVVAWEALGRGVSGGENMSPARMFGLADKFAQNYELSQCLREAAVDCVQCGHCWKQAPEIEIWINLHPSEIVHPGFEEDMAGLVAQSRHARFAAVIEAPETWVSRTDDMRRLVDRVRAVGMRVAYDDFGAGQSRLQDLMSVPPDYIKFDRALIENIRQDPVKAGLVEAMVTACKTLGAVTLAEGVETEEELASCRELGIHLIQGFLLKRPAPAFELFAQDKRQLPASCQHIRLRTL